MACVNSLSSLVVDVPPSCIAIWPSKPEYFVVGTYHLRKNTAHENGGNDAQLSDLLSGETKTQERSGSLILFRLENDDIVHVQTLPTPFAILDIHFSPHDASVLCAATSTGSITLYNLHAPSDTSGQYLLSEVSILQLFPGSTLVLSCAWHPCVRGLIGATLSTGEVKLCKIDLSQQVDHVHSIAHLVSHDLEAWTLAFTPTGDGIFSGGDDTVLKYRGLPTDPDDLAKLFDFGNTESDWQDRRIHGAGVTAVLPLIEGITITGSYDDHIRVLSTPKVGKRGVLAELNLGGGVWRLKRIDGGELSDADGISYRCSILASCMHAGVRVVELTRSGTDGTWNIEVVAKFEGHKSMNYGSDVYPRLRRVMSTSFYDGLLCLWEY